MEELIIKERELKEKIIGLINNANLPAFILKPIFKDLYEQISNIEEQQYNQAVQNKIQRENENDNKKGKKEAKK